MGNDGGSIPKRGDLVKTTSRTEHLDRDKLNYEKWNLCALTMQPLEKPVVACRLGRLYKKESVLNFLLDKSSEASEAFSHIISLKDVKELNIKENPDANRTEPSSKFVCIMTGMELNGKTKAFYYRTCGCVMSLQALAMVKSAEQTCVACGEPVTDQDLIMLNGTREEVAVLKGRLVDEKSRKKTLKKRPKPLPEEDGEAGPVKRPILAPGGEILALRINKNIEELYTKR